MSLLEEKDIDRLKEIFVTRRECQETTQSLETKLNKDNVRLAVIENDLRQIKWLVGTAVAASIANLINSILSLI